MPPDTKHTDPARLRYLADAVATATPAQRIVMLYDRLLLDLRRAGAAAESGDRVGAGEPIRHAQRIVAELRVSLDVGAWSGADDLAALYGFLLRELLAAHGAPEPAALARLADLVAGLRAGWQGAAEALLAEEPQRPVAVAAGSWVG